MIRCRMDFILDQKQNEELFQPNPKHMKNLKEMMRKRNSMKKEMYEKLKPMLNVFETLGFNEVINQFNYTYTRNNLVQLFKRYIPEYIPNTHTINTKTKQFLQIKNNKNISI